MDKSETKKVVIVAKEIQTISFPHFFPTVMVICLSTSAINNKNGGLCNNFSYDIDLVN
jgi:hypothetical protein